MTRLGIGVSDYDKRHPLSEKYGCVGNVTSFRNDARDGCRKIASSFFRLPNTYPFKRNISTSKTDICISQPSFSMSREIYSRHCRSPAFLTLIFNLSPMHRISVFSSFHIPFLLGRSSSDIETLHLPATSMRPSLKRQTSSSKISLPDVQPCNNDV